MWRPGSTRERERALPEQRSVTALELVLGILLVLVLNNVAEASWHWIEGQTLLSGSSAPAVQVLIRLIRQALSTVTMAVAVLVAVPVVIAGVVSAISLIPRYWRPSSRNNS